MVVFMREQDFKSFAQLDEFIKKNADKRQDIQDEIKSIDSKISALSATMEQIHTVKKYRQIYQTYKANKKDKVFFEEYKSQITLYEKALSDLKKPYSKIPDSKYVLSELDSSHEKRIP